MINTDSAIDTVSLAILMGASFVARAFSGDKHQLVPLIKAGLAHEGAAFIDVISPCVAFNNHDGSTKSYDYIREHNEAVNRLDFWPNKEAITVDYDEGEVVHVAQHDGTWLRLRKIRESFDPSDRVGAMNQIQSHAAKGEILTGLLYLNPEAKDLHAHLNTDHRPLNSLRAEDLCPGTAALERLNASLR
jgi:2-oxoglutarate ferredoxin oxidoreductase subunit beta